jgi:hypothetical protein
MLFFCFADKGTKSKSIKHLFYEKYIDKYVRFLIFLVIFAGVIHVLQIERKYAKA